MATETKEYRNGILLPKGTIKFLIGKEMSYSEESIKLGDNIEFDPKYEKD